MERVSCRKCGKDVALTICVDCFGLEATESQRKNMSMPIDEFVRGLCSHGDVNASGVRLYLHYQTESQLRKPPYIEENRFAGDMLEYGAITALFEEIPASEVGVTSGAQSAFSAARGFITEMIVNQCRLAGCVQRDPNSYGQSLNDHTDECWYGKRRKFYADRASAASNSHDE